MSLMADSQAKTSALPPRRSDFVSNYTNKDGPTYGNAKRSYMSAYPNASEATAEVNGSRLLSDTRIQSEIERILEENEASYKVRVKELVAIATNRADLQAETESFDSDGNLVSRSKTRRSVPTADRLKALKLISDLTGETQMAHTQGELVSQRLKQLSRRMMKRVGESSTITPLDAVESHSEPSDGAERVSSGDQGLEGGKGGGLYTIHSPQGIREGKKPDPPESTP